jgi:DNA-binding NarL/FixJ family response regulator
VIRVAVVDDQALVRTGFVMLLDATDGVEVVSEAADGVEAVDVVRRTRPDVVLMDIRMPRMDGIEATRRICADPGCHGARVLVLTTFDQDDLVFSALHAGASGFLLKEPARRTCSRRSRSSPAATRSSPPA